MCTQSSGNVFAQDNEIPRNSADKIGVAQVESPWDYLDANSKRFVPNLLLFVLRRERNSQFRDKAMNILLEYFSIPEEDKFLKGAFSKQGSEMWKCLFKSKTDYIIQDGFKLLLALFTTHKDAFLRQLGPSNVFHEVVKLWWSPKFMSDVGIVFRTFIQHGSRREVSYIFQTYQVLETLSSMARIKADANNNQVATRTLEYQLLQMFRAKMINQFRDGYQMWLRVAREYELE